METKDIIFLIIVIFFVSIGGIYLYDYYNENIKLIMLPQDKSNKTVIFDDDVYNELLIEYNKPYEKVFCLKGEIEKNKFYIEELKELDGDFTLYNFTISFKENNCYINDGYIGMIHTHILKSNAMCLFSKQDLYLAGIMRVLYGTRLFMIECGEGKFVILDTTTGNLDYETLKWKIENFI